VPILTGKMVSSTPVTLGAVSLGVRVRGQALDLMWKFVRLECVTLPPGFGGPDLPQSDTPTEIKGAAPFNFDAGWKTEGLDTFRSRKVWHLALSGAILLILIFFRVLGTRVTGLKGVYHVHCRNGPHH